MPISIKYILIVLVLVIATYNRGNGGGPMPQDTKKPGKKGKRIRLLQ